MELLHWIPTVVRKEKYLDVYSSMLETGTIFVNAPIDQRVSGLISSCIVHLCGNGSEAREPKIYLNTRRGDVMSAIAVVDMMEFYKRQEVRIHTLAIGEIGVAGVLVLAAGTKGFRKATEHCRLLLHFGEENFDFGSVIGAQGRSREIGRVQTECLKILSNFSGKDEGEFRDRSGSEEYLTAGQGLGLGLVDELV